MLLQARSKFVVETSVGLFCSSIISDRIDLTNFYDNFRT